jgi:hypothetical protein
MENSLSENKSNGEEKFLREAREQGGYLDQCGFLVSNITV